MAPPPPPPAAAAGGGGAAAGRPPLVGTTVRGATSLPRDFLKVPTGWPFRDPYDFMEGKRADDGVPAHLWRVHDQLYDLSGFKHPGGAQWLSLTRGTDVTELFETHHLDMGRVARVLAVYAVEPQPGDAPLPPRWSPFTFEPDGFYCTLRRKIWAAHGGDARRSGASRVAALGAPVSSKALADVMFAVSMALTAAAGMARGRTTAALITVAAAVLNGGFIGIGHNFLHQADNFRRHYMGLSGFCSAEFRMHHALSHHPYSNTVMDAELNGLLPDINFFPGERSAAEKTKMLITLAIVNALALPGAQTVRFVRILMGTWPGDSSDKLEQLLPIAQFLLLSRFRGSPARGLGLWLLMKLTTSNVFLWGNFLNGPHFNDECWHQGDTLDSRDWGILQVQASVERSAMSHEDTGPVNLWNMPTFGLHHLHHLFPTIDATQLSKLVPLFNEHCKEWNVTYRTMTDRELAAGLAKCVGGYGPNTRTRCGIGAPAAKL